MYKQYTWPSFSPSNGEAIPGCTLFSVQKKKKEKENNISFFTLLLL